MNFTDRPLSIGTGTNSNVTINYGMKTLRIILLFYKPFAFTSFFLTATCGVTIYYYGIIIFQVLFWFKLITLGMLYFYINSYKSNEFYYYKNLGLSRSRLWISVLVFDFCFFLISMIFIAIKLHETHP